MDAAQRIDGAGSGTHQLSEPRDAQLRSGGRGSSGREDGRNDRCVEDWREGRMTLPQEDNGEYMPVPEFKGF